ncbi:MAG: Gfo/Idh/MocA family protein [Acidimicrobiales bacterium]
MSGAPIALGLVGCGRLATAGYLPAFAATTDVRLAAVADPEPTRRATVASLVASGTSDAGSVATFADATALLDGIEVEGLILATPAAAHLADAVVATQAGVAVLVEKPPAPDAAGAAALAALEPAPWVGFNRRFDPGAEALRQLVPADRDVDLRLEISYRRRSWGAHAVRDDALLDLGPHLVDCARWISSGDAVEVRCTELSAERARLELTLTRGRAVVRAATDRPHREIVDLRDGAGTLLARHRLGGRVAAVRARLARGSGVNPLVVSLTGQLRAFAATIHDAHPSALGSAADGLAAMSVVDAARTSAARSGRPVPVTQPVGR